MKRSTYSSYDSSIIWAKRALLIAVFGGFGSLIWYAAANRDDLQVEPEDVPLIRAEQGAVKVRAEKPGGMEVPNRDKKVFDLLADEKVAEDLTPEKPCDSDEEGFVCADELPKVEALAPVKTLNTVDVADVPSSDDDIANLIESTQEEKKGMIQLLNTEVKEEVNAPAPVVKAEEVKEPVVEKTAEAPKVEEPAKQVVEQTAPKVEEKPEVKTEVAAGAYGVQLGSYGSEKSANGAAEEFRKKLGSLLDGLMYQHQKATVNGKDYYRVRFMGLKAKEDAQALCKQIQAKDQGCWHTKN